MDYRICQTATASPAEPGASLVGLASFCRETRKPLLGNVLTVILRSGAAAQLAVELRKPRRRSQECCEFLSSNCPLSV
jgi:hypothetical protein